MSYIGGVTSGDVIHRRAIAGDVTEKRGSGERARVTSPGRPPRDLALSSPLALTPAAPIQRR